LLNIDYKTNRRRIAKMEISVQELKRVNIMTVAGRIDSSNATELDEALKDLLGNGRYNIVLDLAGVEYMSSAGLRALVSAVRECKRRGGDLRLTTPSERVSEVLKLAGLDSIFQTFDDSTTAVGSF
jgi:anti-sigma B factor antagonist